MQYISIDGDDIGKKITSYYLCNDSKKLQRISDDLKDSTQSIATYLQNNKFEIIFCAADGVVASIESLIDLKFIFKNIQKLAPKDISFSMGVGNSLSEAYIALLAAKSNGKNCMYSYKEVGIDECLE